MDDEVIGDLTKEDLQKVGFVSEGFRVDLKRHVAVVNFAFLAV